MKSYKTIYFEEIDSTNKYLKDNYNLLDNFTFVSTSYQSNGKGRNDRVWLSNKGDNLMFSLLIKNERYVSKGGFLSLIASYSVTRVLMEKYHLKNVLIKWPNDIYVNDKKICGILLEGNIPHYIVIGVGLNVNQDLFKGNYRKTPTSIKLELGYQIDINILKEAVYDALFEDITTEKDYISYFNDHNYLQDKKVKIRYDNNDITGVIVGVDEKYNLILKGEEKEYLISSGEIEIL